jgi:hypothetical protein
MHRFGRKSLPHPNVVNCPQYSFYTSDSANYFFCESVSERPDESNFTGVGTNFAQWQMCIARKEEIYFTPDEKRTYEII